MLSGHDTFVFVLFLVLNKCPRGHSFIPMLHYRAPQHFYTRVRRQAAIVEPSSSRLKTERTREPIDRDNDDYDKDSRMNVR